LTKSFENVPVTLTHYSVKLFLKGNEKLTFAMAVGVFSTLVLSAALSPLLVKAQSQNETGTSQQLQQQVIDLSTLFFLS
jgi:hypothetical protein